MPVWYRVCVTRLSERPSEASRGRKVVDCKDTARLKTNGLERDVGTSLSSLKVDISRLEPPGHLY